MTKNEEQEEDLYEELQNGGSTDVEIDETEQEEEKLPINTFEKVVYYTNQFSTNNLIDMIDAKDLDLGDTDLISKDNIELDMFKGNIKYQRNFVWEPKVQNKFIESIILNLPIPNLIFYTKSNKISFNVIDGKQRLTTLFLFIKGKIGIDRKYLNIEINDLLKEKIEDKKPIYFSNLKEELKKRLKYYRLNVTTIDLDSGLNDKIKTKLEYEIFDRLNTGSVTLSWQEIRNNIIADSYLQEKIKELSNLESFKNIYYSHKEGTDIFNISGNYTKRKRMYDQELIVRTIFFLERIKLNKDYLIKEKNIIFNSLNELDDLSKNDCIIKTFDINKFYSMKRNLDLVVEDLKNEEEKDKIDEYVEAISKTFNDLHDKGGDNICRKDGTIAFNVSLFESIFIPLLYCNYYKIGIGKNIDNLSNIKEIISEDQIFKQIVDKGGSTKKDYIIYKILLGLKNFIN